MEKTTPRVQSRNDREDKSNPHENLDRIFFKLKQLHEVQDQSRNELCPIFPEDDSLGHPHTSWPQQLATQVDLLRDLDDSLRPASRKDAEFTATVASHRSHYNPANDHQLLESNRKLKADNSKLFAECIRLRKKCQLYEESLSHKGPSQKEKQLQHQLATLKSSIEQLKVDNGMLEEKVRKLQRDNQRVQREGEKVQRENERVWEERQRVERTGQQLALRVLALERELETCAGNQSVSNSTRESRKAEGDKDRMISNMKVVHQSEVRKLKTVIEELRRDLNRQLSVKDIKR